MAEPYLSEIRIFSFGFPPKGWALCNGQIMPINQNQALFSLLGTTFGGDGRVNFALPNLQSRVPLHAGNGFTLGQSGGESAHTISIQELPVHTHTVMASSKSPDSISPENNTWASNTGFNIYANNIVDSMSSESIGRTGGSQAHENRPPFLTLNFCIALQGIFPTQS